MLYVISCWSPQIVAALDCVVSAMENPESLQEVKDTHHVIEVFV
jgi:hypothetical protein